MINGFLVVQYISQSALLKIETYSSTKDKTHFIEKKNVTCAQMHVEKLWHLNISGFLCFESIWNWSLQTLNKTKIKVSFLPASCPFSKQD